MLVKVKRVDGFVEMFTTDKYTLSTIKLLHPAIIKAEVFSDTGKKIVCLKRPFAFIYKHFIFKPEMLEGLEEVQPEDTQNNDTTQEDKQVV